MFKQDFKRTLACKLDCNGVSTFNLENAIALAAYAVGGFFGGRAISKATKSGRFFTNKPESSSQSAAPAAVEAEV